MIYHVCTYYFPQNSNCGERERDGAVVLIHTKILKINISVGARTHE
jgi:hypothetical protein